MPAEARCVERARLADILAQAVADLYAINREYQRAKNRNEDTVRITLVLQTVTSMLQTSRDVERSAVHAYDDHIKKHGCKF